MVGGALIARDIRREKVSVRNFAKEMRLETNMGSVEGAGRFRAPDPEAAALAGGGLGPLVGLLALVGGGLLLIGFPASGRNIPSKHQRYELSEARSTRYVTYLGILEDHFDR